MTSINARLTGNEGNYRRGYVCVCDIHMEIEKSWQVSLLNVPDNVSLSLSLSLSHRSALGLVLGDGLSHTYH